MTDPPSELLTDARRLLAQLPTDTPQARFEALTWPLLLQHHGQQLLTRECTPCHLTASAVALTPDGSRTSLVLHPRLGAWVQPGGHLEPDDTSVAGAAERELAEETGLRSLQPALLVAAHRHRAPCRTGADWHLDVQFVVSVAEAPLVLSAESLQVQWFDVAALPRQLAPGVADLVSAAARRLRGHSPSPVSGPIFAAAEEPSEEPRARSARR